MESFCVVTRLDEGERVGFGCGHTNVIHCCVCFVVLDVLEETGVEEDRLLGDKAKETTKVMDVEVLDVDSVKENLSFIRVIESEQHLDNR